VEERDDQPEEAAQLANNEIASRRQLYKEYERTLRAYQAVDFDDLIRLPVRCSTNTPRCASAGRTSCATCWWTNTRTPTAPSTGCCKLLAGVRGAFTAVGDDDQAIYAWRGADVENLKLLQQ
jgi:ATP-dependent DNA helicase Rep